MQTIGWYFYPAVMLADGRFVFQQANIFPRHGIFRSRLNLGTLQSIGKWFTRCHWVCAGTIWYSAGSFKSQCAVKSPSEKPYHLCGGRRFPSGGKEVQYSVLKLMLVQQTIVVPLEVSTWLNASKLVKEVLQERELVQLHLPHGIKQQEKMMYWHTSSPLIEKGDQALFTQLNRKAAKYKKLTN